MLARMQTRVEAARPSSWIDVARNASALADRAHVQVTVMDVPGDLVRIVGAAAADSGHDSSESRDMEAARDGRPAGADPRCSHRI